MILAYKESYNRVEDTDSSIIINQHPHPHPHQHHEQQQEEEDEEEDEEESVETLSLCDLPIYSDESNCDDYQSASFDDHNQEDDTFFEFFSHDFSVANSSYSGSDNIIFCGKLIPYKQPSDSQIKPSDNFSGKKSSVSDTRSGPGGIKSFDPFSISLTNNSIPEYIKRPKRKWKLQKYELPEERAMILQSSPMKSRWFLFLFGSARFPKEMELSEMRIRQRRSMRLPEQRQPSSEERKVAKGRSKGKKTTTFQALCKVLRALVIGCSSSNHRNGALNASFRPISAEK